MTIPAEPLNPNKVITMRLIHWLFELRNNLFRSPIGSRHSRRLSKRFGSGHADTAFPHKPEVLEDRTLLASIMVNTPLDRVDSNDGLTSLREAILLANFHVGPDEIQFDSSLRNQTIVLNGTQLPEITGQLFLVGPGSNQLVVSGDGLSRIFTIEQTVPVFISGLTIAHGRPEEPSDLDLLQHLGPGGGILNRGSLTISDLRISSNTASAGGGIYNSGFLSVTNSLIEDNSAIETGGGISNAGELILQSTLISENQAGQITGVGGGISTSGSASIYNSMIFANRLPGGFGSGIGVAAGTLVVETSTIFGNGSSREAVMGFLGGIASAGNTIVRNSTISGNRVGLYVSAGGRIEAHSTTIADNNAGIINRGTALLHNSLAAGNDSDIPPNFVNLHSNSSFNLIGNEAASGGLTHNVNENIVGIDPLLGPLQYNGGSTFTHALDPSSIAIDRGDPALIGTSDQRGVGRPQRGGIDIGAFELRNAVHLVLPGTSGDDIITVTHDGASTTITTNGSSRTYVDAELLSISLQPGDGNDVIQIHGTPNLPITVFAGSGDDTIHIGGGDYYQNIRGAITIHGSSGEDRITIDDSESTRVPLSSLWSELDREIRDSVQYGTFVKVAQHIESPPAPERPSGKLSFEGIDTVTVEGGSLADVFLINATKADTHYVLRGNEGDDVFVVGDPSGLGSRYDGLIDIYGNSENGDNDRLVIDDLIPFTPIFSNNYEFDIERDLSGDFFGTFRYGDFTDKLNPVESILHFRGLSNVELQAGSRGQDIIVKATLAETHYRLYGNGGRDTFEIDAAGLNSNVTVSGGEPNVAPGDTLVIIGTGDSDGHYTPTGTHSGQVDVDEHVITFSGLEPIEIQGFDTFTMTTPLGRDELQVRPSEQRSGWTWVGGTSGVDRHGFESVLFTEVRNFVLDAATNDYTVEVIYPNTPVHDAQDLITLEANALNAVGLEIFRIEVGGGANVVTDRTLESDQPLAAQLQLSSLEPGTAHLVYGATDLLEIDQNTSRTTTLTARDSQSRRRHQFLDEGVSRIILIDPQAHLEVRTDGDLWNLNELSNGQRISGAGLATLEIQAPATDTRLSLLVSDQTLNIHEYVIPTELEIVRDPAAPSGGGETFVDPIMLRVFATAGSGSAVLRGFSEESPVILHGLGSSLGSLATTFAVDLRDADNSIQVAQSAMDSTDLWTWRILPTEGEYAHLKLAGDAGVTNSAIIDTPSGIGWESIKLLVELADIELLVIQNPEESQQVAIELLTANRVEAKISAIDQALGELTLVSSDQLRQITSLGGDRDVFHLSGTLSQNLTTAIGGFEALMVDAGSGSVEHTWGSLSGQVKTGGVVLLHDATLAESTTNASLVTDRLSGRFDRDITLTRYLTGSEHNLVIEAAEFLGSFSSTTVGHPTADNRVFIVEKDVSYHGEKTVLVSGGQDDVVLLSRASVFTHFGSTTEIDTGAGQDTIIVLDSGNGQAAGTRDDYLLAGDGGEKVVAISAGPESPLEQWDELILEVPELETVRNSITDGDVKRLLEASGGEHPVLGTTSFATQYRNAQVQLVTRNADIEIAELIGTGITPDGDYRTFAVTTTADNGPGSLRAAIEDANAWTGTGLAVIFFAIDPSDSNFRDVDAERPDGDAAPDVFVISPETSLPALMRGNILINGQSQLIATGDTNPFGPEIVLSGERASNSTVIPGLISLYRFNGSANDEAGDNQPSATAGLSFVEGKLGEGVTFEPGGYIDIPHSPALENQVFTISAWVRPDGPGPNDDEFGNTIIQKSVSNVKTSFKLSWSAQSQRFVLYSGDIRFESQGTFSADAFGPGRFYHVAATFDGETFRLYVDGTLQGEFLHSGPIPYEPSIPWTIGSTAEQFRDRPVQPNYPRTWNGVIDEVGIYNRALSQAEIQWLMMPVNGVQLASSTNRVHGLNIQDFSGNGALVTGDGNTLTGNYIGTTADGMAALGNGEAGVRFEDSSDNLVGGATVTARNVISANGTGVLIVGSLATGNHVAGNYIGVAAGGVTDLGNTLRGVFVGGAGAGNVIGGESPAERNIISGNGINGYGIGNIFLKSMGTLVQGNYIGTDWTGTVQVASDIRDGVGIWLEDDKNSVITGNLIAGNNDGIRIDGRWVVGGTENTRIQGNRIGTNIDGGSPLRNRYGIYIAGHVGSDGVTHPVNNVVIGGTNDGAGNLISGNINAGILAFGPGVQGLDIVGNRIGTDIDGNIAIPNGVGVHLDNTHGVFIGGTTQEARNVISGNTGSGISIAGGSEHVVQGNFIGTTADGLGALGNGGGISIANSTGVVIGGPTDEARNVISASTAGYGVTIQGVGATGNLVEGNYIGTDVTGTLDRGNANSGVLLQDATDNTLRGNVISGNNVNGVFVVGSTPTTDVSNLIEENFIGTDATGTQDLGNTLMGVRLLRGTGLEVRGNVISGNDNSNVLIDALGSDVLIADNFIGTDLTGNAPLQNPQGLPGFGVTLTGHDNHVIGNVISGNPRDGVVIDALHSMDGRGSGNVLQQNLIGLGADGGTPLPNIGNGVRVWRGANNNTIGTDGDGLLDEIEGNAIAHNTGAGVAVVDAGSVGNSIRGNAIHSNGGLGIDLGPSPGVTPNDPLDADEGGNLLQNFPIIEQATLNLSLALRGRLFAAPLTEYIIDFYAGSDADPSGHGEGRHWLGSMTVRTGEVDRKTGQAVAAFRFLIPLEQFPDAQFITATATDLLGNTSEFSNAQVIQIQGPGKDTANLIESGSATSLEAQSVTVTTSPFMERMTTDLWMASPILTNPYTQSSFQAPASPLTTTEEMTEGVPMEEILDSDWTTPSLAQSSWDFLFADFELLLGDELLEI